MRCVHRSTICWHALIGRACVVLIAVGPVLAQEAVLRDDDIVVIHCPEHFSFPLNPT